MPPPEDPPAISAARTLAAEQFYQGKSLALAGEGDCAREAFRDALETFRVAAREGNLSDLAFASELYDSIALYRSAIEAGARAAEAERPPAEDPRDSLVATAPLPSPDEVEKAKTEVGSAASGTGFDIPIVVNDAVLRAVAFYQFRTPMAFAAALKRSGRYLDLMRGILKEEGVPQDLVYVAMVESAFKYQAHSRAAAHGFWQFIAGTGKRYGLKRNRSLDERSDPVKSTRAAAAYLPRPVRDVRGLAPRDGRVRRGRGPDPEEPPAHGRARLLGARGGQQSPARDARLRAVRSRDGAHREGSGALRFRRRARSAARVGHRDGP